MKKIAIIGMSVAMLSFVYANGVSTNCGTNSVSNCEMTTKSTYQLTDTDKQKVDKVFDTFLAKLQKKGDNYTLKTLDTLIKKIDEMVIFLNTQNKKSTPKSIAILEYLKSLASKGFMIGESTTSEITKQTLYIQSVSTKDGKIFVKGQVIEFYTGDAAVEKLTKLEPGVCEEMKKADQTDKCYPLNDYYIIKTDSVVELELSANPEILMQTFSDNDGAMNWNQKVDLKTFIDVINVGKKFDNNYIKYNNVPFYLWSTDGKVTKIVEQFIP